MGADFGHHYCTRVGQGGAPPPDYLGRKISRPTATGRTGIGPAKRRRATVGHGYFLDFLAISGQFRPPHSSFPPFLDPLNSFPWSFSPDSSPFERYDKNKFGRLLDLVFRLPQQPLDQGEGTDVFLVSWAFH